MIVFHYKKHHTGIKSTLSVSVLCFVLFCFFKQAFTDSFQNDFTVLKNQDFEIQNPGLIGTINLLIFKAAICQVKNANALQEKN